MMWIVPSLEKEEGGNPASKPRCKLFIFSWTILIHSPSSIQPNNLIFDSVL
jgi:hypothetical protein